MSKYFSLIKDDYKIYNDVKVYRIKYLVDTKYCKAEDLGGYVDDRSVVHTSFISKDSVVINSKIINAVISDNSVINFSFICDSKVADSNIKNTKIKCESVLEKALIEDSEIKSSIVTDCIITKSQIENSKIEADVRTSYLVQCNIASAVNNSRLVCVTNIRVETFSIQTINLNSNISNANMKGSAECPIVINSFSDYLVFKNWWSSGRFFTYVPKIKTWFVGCFVGNHEELIAKAYKDSESKGNHYKAIVEFVKSQGL